MSIITCSLVLVLLCFSFHACNARSFGVVHKEAASEFQHSISKKNEEVNSTRVSSRSNAFKDDAKEEIIFEERKMINSESNEQKVAKLSSTTKTSEYVSWKVPHQKRGEQEVPGFNLDYLPPKTHPPVHN